MSKTIIAASAMALLAIATPILAEPSAPAKVENPNDPNRMVCKRIEATGTRLASKRVCQTAAQWDAVAAANRQEIERSQTQRWKSD